MNTKKPYEIDVAALDAGKNSFEFVFDNAFFSTIEQDIIQKGSIKSQVIIDKSELMMRVKIINKGTVELICDRTLLPFDFELETDNGLIFNFSDRNEEINEEVILIRRDTAILDLSIYIYEFIILGIPLKKIHPDYIRKDEEENDDNILIYSSISHEDQPEDSNIDILDPRWAALKKLKENL